MISGLRVSASLVSHLADCHLRPRGLDVHFIIHDEVALLGAVGVGDRLFLDHVIVETRRDYLSAFNKTDRCEG